MDNRRTEMRKKVMAFTPVRDHERGILLGFVGDLTLQGTLVIGEKALEVGAITALEIEFPGELPGAPTRRMVLHARAVRCVKDEESERDFKIGFEFSEIQPEQTRIIEALLDRYYFRYREWEKKNE